VNAIQIRLNAVKSEKLRSGATFENLNLEEIDADRNSFVLERESHRLFRLVENIYLPEGGKHALDCLREIVFKNI
jgi:hypothetical protein